MRDISPRPSRENVLESFGARQSSARSTRAARVEAATMVNYISGLVFVALALLGLVVCGVDRKSVV